MRIRFPDVLRIEKRVLRSPIRQLAERGWSADGGLASFKRNKRKARLFTPNDGSAEAIVTSDPKFVRPSDSHVVLLPKDHALTAELSDGRWLRHPSRVSDPDLRAECVLVRASWANAFNYVEENGDVGTIGLRKPQIGAVHAVHSHWSISREVGTVVMPTGTGKTEVMLSVLVSAMCERLLVLVPTDALRTQLADKFLSLGVLKVPGSSILAPAARFPVVGMLTHIPDSIEEVDLFFEQCQVVVTTSAIAGHCAEPIQRRMAHHCPFLFIDEAHHTEAPTWRTFKERFAAARVLQFTATPFREDGRPLDGRIIYKYPLKKAQQDGYFRPIRFRSVCEFNAKRVDEAIAEVALGQLRDDASKGHILMARVDNIRDAQRVFKIYERYSQFKPVQLHTGIKSAKEREAAKRAVLTGKSKIVVCVDMLGEGFDLPELKIAAFHDVRKTLAVTLQLAGRFTRARADLGNATFIANVADVNVKAELRKLYDRDPDWNELLPELSDTLIGEQVALQTFLAGFSEFPDEIPLKTVRPACSAVVYKTKCQHWTPENFRNGIPGIASCAQVYPALNTEKSVLVVVTAKRLGLDWSDVETVYHWQWELYVLYWSEAKQLLFINCSANTGEYAALARAVAGEDVTLIKGQDVFRAFAGITRMKLQNVGLSEQLGRNVRYTGRMGADVEQALSEVIKRKSRKSVLAGAGFENGRRATIGASRRGRVWSHQRAQMGQFLTWCDGIGTKLLDDTINPDEVLTGTLSSEAVTARPAVMPIAADWPEDMYKTEETIWTITLNGVEFPLGELTIDLVDPSVEGPLQLSVSSETESAVLVLELFEDDETPNYRFRVLGDANASIRRGDRAEPRDLADFFYDHPPIIWFADGASIEGNEHVPLKARQPPYNAERIAVWDWTGTDIRKESQGPSKMANSVQARVIRELQKDPSHAVIFDDDGKGELADVVGIRLLGHEKLPDAIEVELYHCKYAKADTAGARINDLYEVCGQAQKCISWLASGGRATDMFTHLLRREAAANEHQFSRLERGTMDDLAQVREMSREREIRVKVFVVQPGLSKSRASRDQLELLSVAENHLKETYQLPFGVIANS